MGRPKGSKNKPKDDAPAEAGHNTALTEDEKRALFIKGVQELEGLLEKKNDAVSAVRNQRKRIVSYGFDAFEIDYALKVRKDEDDALVERRRREARIARFLNHPIGTEPDMFDEVDCTPAVDKAYQEGKVAGAAGQSAKSPYAPGLPQDQSWLKGWGDGQADLSSGFKKLEQATSNSDEKELEAA